MDCLPTSVKMILDSFGHVLDLEKIKHMIKCNNTIGTSIECTKMEKFSRKLLKNEIPYMFVPKKHNKLEDAVSTVDNHMAKYPVILLYNELQYNRGGISGYEHATVCIEFDYIKNRVIGNDPLSKYGEKYFYKWDRFKRAWSNSRYPIIFISPLSQRDMKKRKGTIIKNAFHKQQGRLEKDGTFRRV